MRIRRAVGWLLCPVLILAACSSPNQGRPVVTPPAQTETPPVSTPPGRPEKDQEEEPPTDKEQPPTVLFHLYTGPLGFKFPEARRELSPGASTVVGLEPFDLDVFMPGLSEAAARKALKVEGAEMLAEPAWLPEGGLALQIGQVEDEQVTEVRVEVSGRPPAILTIRRAAPASVTVDQRHVHSWKPITVLDAYSTPGPSAVRLNFSKAVRKEEVEQALLAAQSTPIRGLMEWTDDQTLTWQLAELPPRLDFLLGGAHDVDGLPLPGGIPSLRLGEPPILVEVVLAEPADLVRGTLPPDIISATPARGGKIINLMAWTPGTTKWDWQKADVYFDVETKHVKRGRVEESLPRLPEGLESWTISPNGGLVAGLKSRGAATESYQADLVVMDIRGGRLQTFPGVVGQFRGVDQLDLFTHLAWSPDSLQIAALSYAGDPQSSELILIEAATGKRTVLVPDLPIRSDGTRLAWSPDGRWLLAGNLLVDIQSKGVRYLDGLPDRSSGVWEPGGSLLLYGVQDWGPVQIIEPAKEEVTPLGDGMIVGWAGPGRVLVIRWPGSDTRYVPPGQ